MSGFIDTRDFLESLNEGHDSAIEKLFQEYVERLEALAARKMGPHIGAEPDSIAMSAMGSVIRGIREGRFKFEDSRRLWNLLVTITLNKIRKRWEKGKHTQPAPPDLNRLLAQGPSAEDAAILEDLIETVLTGLDSTYRDIFLMFLAGNTRTEIADQLDITYAAVKYRLRRAIARLERLLSESDRD